MDEIANFDEHWDAWDHLDEECNKRHAEVQRLIDTVRTTRRIPKREMEHALRRVRRLLGEIKNAEFRRIDREELATRAKMQMAVLTFLRDRSHAQIEPSGTEIRALLDATHLPVQFADRVARYESQTMLAILSKPAGNEYWQLMRSIANGVKDDRKTDAGHKLEELQNVLKFLAPAWLLYDDRKHIPTSGKWAWRTTKVHGVYNGGLPGLGKKA
jgi:hypothetical protein